MKTTLAVITFCIMTVIGVWQFSAAQNLADTSAKAALVAAATKTAANADQAARHNAVYLAKRNMDKIEDLKVDVVETYVSTDCPMGRGWVEVKVQWTFDNVHWNTERQWCSVNDRDGSCYTKRDLKSQYPDAWFDAKQSKHLGGGYVCDRSLAPISRFE